MPSLSSDRCVSHDEVLTYESDEVVAKFNADDFSLIDLKNKSDTLNKFNFKHAVEMYFLLKSLKDFSIFK